MHAVRQLDQSTLKGVGCGRARSGGDTRLRGDAASAVAHCEWALGLDTVSQELRRDLLCCAARGYARFDKGQVGSQ